jgi:cyclopropane fatty-acyl-phospholipid synthase-like methyltransferase
MKLYHNPQRIFNELKSHQDDNSTLKVEDLCSFDQYHYLGTAAVDDAISTLKLGPDDSVIDIGSGIGGPARYMAEKTGCQVTALELQPELNEIATNLTDRCGLSNQVLHQCGDILDFPEDKNVFNFAVSWLSFLHIQERNSLFSKCFNILKPTGKMFIEDFYKINEFSEKEIRVLDYDISCVYLPSKEEYIKQLISNGFMNVNFYEKTKSWKTFVKERKNRFIENHESQIKTHDEKIVDELEDFYKKMDWLFDGDNLGGLRIIAEK